MRSIKILFSAATLVSGFSFVSFITSSNTSATAIKNCVAAHLRISLGVAEGAAGTIYHPVVFTNTGLACLIFGVPGIQPVIGGASHSLIAVGPPARNQSMGEMPAMHVLMTRKSVSAAFAVTESGNYSAGACRAKNAGGIIVTMDSFVTRAYLPLRISVCTKKSNTSTRLITFGTAGF